MEGRSNNGGAYNAALYTTTPAIRLLLNRQGLTKREVVGVINAKAGKKVKDTWKAITDRVLIPEEKRYLREPGYAFPSQYAITVRGAGAGINGAAGAAGGLRGAGASSSAATQEPYPRPGQIIGSDPKIYGGWKALIHGKQYPPS